VHLIDFAAEEDSLTAYRAVNHELAAFDAELAAKPQIVVATKLDVTEARERLASVAPRFAELGIELHGISAVSGAGVAALMTHIAAAVRRARRERRAVDETDAAASDRNAASTFAPEPS
jgi:GTP-binding protein